MTGHKNFAKLYQPVLEKGLVTAPHSRWTISTVYHRARKPTLFRGGMNALYLLRCYSSSRKLKKESVPTGCGISSLRRFVPLRVSTRNEKWVEFGRVKSTSLRNRKPSQDRQLEASTQNAQRIAKAPRQESP